MQQYQGPNNYWTEHTLVPGERYMYGYYGFYSPLVNPKYYRDITIDEDIQKNRINKKTNSCNSCNGTLMWTVIIVCLLILFSKLNRFV